MQRYTPDMLVCDVLAADPRAASVFASLGLVCPSCLGASMDTLTEVAAMHDVDVETLVDALDALPTDVGTTEGTT